MELSNRHRDTVEHIFDRPSSGNVEWREVLSLLEAVGDVDEEPNGRYRVTFGGETEVFVRPHGKDVDVQVLVDLRRRGVVPHCALKLDRSPFLGESFVDARLQIINDLTAPAGDRLRAMEQLESRALGKPKESVTVDTEESETERALRQLTPAQRLELWKRRGLRAVDDDQQEEEA